MKAMEYWRCAETGLVFSEERGNERKRPKRGTNMMFVVAEALPDQGTSRGNPGVVQ